MTGPDHYREAERLLVGLNEIMDRPAVAREDVRAGYELAQVHATLALAAAVAMGAGRADGHGMSPKDDADWREACSAGWSE